MILVWSYIFKAKVWNVNIKDMIEIVVSMNEQKTKNDYIHISTLYLCVYSWFVILCVYSVYVYM